MTRGNEEGVRWKIRARTSSTNPNKATRNNGGVIARSPTTRCLARAPTTHNRDARLTPRLLNLDATFVLGHHRQSCPLFFFVLTPTMADTTLHFDALYVGLCALRCLRLIVPAPRLFDMDGTLVDSTDGVVGAWELFAESYPHIDVHDILSCGYSVHRRPPHSDLPRLVQLPTVSAPSTISGTTAV